MKLSALPLACAMALVCASSLAGAADAWTPLARSGSATFELDAGSARAADASVDIDIRGALGKAERAPGSRAPYRSFTATARVDCAARSAWILTQRFFERPAWSGAPHTSADYAEAEPSARVGLAFLTPAGLSKLLDSACSKGRAGA